jgi:adhesin transport system outer membrane protein
MKPITANVDETNKSQFPSWLGRNASSCMMKFQSVWRSASALGLALLMSGPALAQAQEVRLTHLLDLAMSQHPTILQSLSQAQAAGYDLAAAKWGRFPSASTEMRSDNASAQSIARIEQPLWAGGRINGRIDLGEANLRVAESSVREAELNALTQVSISFFEVQRLLERLNSADENVKEHQRLLDLITRRMEAKISPEADVTLATARLQQALTERLQIQRQFETTRNTLTQWAGPIQGRLVSPSSIDYKRPQTPESLLEQVLKVSGQRARLQAQIESAEAQIGLAKAQGLPTVVAGVQRVVSGPLYTPDRSHSYLSLQFQPGAGLSALSGISSAVAKKAAAQRELEALDRLLENQAKSLDSDISVLQSQLKPAQDLLSGTSDVVDSYLRQYQIGRKNWLDVLNALREKTQAQYNLADVRSTLQQSQVKMLLLLGELTGQNNTVIHE